jgi:hypothetical protein
MPDDRIRPDDPKSRRSDEPEATEARPRRRRRDEDDFDDDFDRPRRRRRDEEETDGTGGLIPYKNGLALGSYYTGVFSLIPGVGLVLGPIALVLGIMGFKYANKHPTARGKAHAVVGIILGLLNVIGYLACLVLIIIAAISK